MLKKLFCKHNYKFYNTDKKCVLYAPYNIFEFVCDKCGKEQRISDIEINDKWSTLKSKYKKSLVLGGEPLEESKCVIPSYPMDRRYSGPVATLLIDEYLSKGIDLREIKPNDYYYKI